MNREKLIQILAAILALNLGLIIIVERNLDDQRLQKFFYIFSALPFLAAVAILAINRFTPLPQLAEGEMLKRNKKPLPFSYRRVIINFLVWLGLAIAAALIFFLVWLSLRGKTIF